MPTSRTPRVRLTASSTVQFLRCENLLTGLNGTGGSGLAPSSAAASVLSMMGSMVATLTALPCWPSPATCPPRTSSCCTSTPWFSSAGAISLGRRSPGSSLHCREARGSNKPTVISKTAATAASAATSAAALRNSEQSVLNLSAYFDTPCERASASRVGANPLEWNIWKNLTASFHKARHASRTLPSAVSLAPAAATSASEPDKASRSASGPLHSEKKTSSESRPKE
mmetsp:Transcript_66702/g.211020  ORF Transcript_66702/g.211020 Transcript_66702/m.211020 type:complete len:227 (-) Transcript_66702:1365-2045(-)